jgi:uncharacterized protein (TIGR00725 family)
MPPRRRKVLPGPAVSVVGSGSAPREQLAAAREVGRLLAEAGYTVVCGGLGGVMEEACRGAREAGGLTIGILPGLSRTDANPFVDVPVVTGLGEARNVIVATTGHAVVAVGGSLGTLTEVAFALKHHIPVVGIDTWELEVARLPGMNVFAVETPAEAVAKVREVLS